ncbi:short-chain collagen C4-like [Mytilus californianus]|uniref:short-chain collagen C4-like n=1 Tax=Mytilus californianus TaxID=6549 RepID=UPI002246DCDC|nr:short-chain collagen C4-like [Mytilus californianus]
MRVWYVTLLLACVLLILPGHECRDSVLSASDQSLIDMMKNYLLTSRKDECPQQRETTHTGVSYVRWGKKACPEGVALVYTGQVGGNKYTHSGGGVNYLCLPNDPENGEHQPYGNPQVYGGEYEVRSGKKPAGWSASMYNKEIPCAVCYQKRRSTVLMIPGRKSCYKGWDSEYNGYLMSDHYTHYKKDFVCVDRKAETLDNSNASENGALFFPLRTSCGSLRCPPYTNSADVFCVVCTK